VEQLPGERQLAEAHLGDGPPLAILTGADDPALDAVEAEDELAHDRRLVVDHTEVDGGLAVEVVAEGPALGAAVPEQRAGQLDPASGGHAGGPGGGQEVGRAAGGPAARGPDPHVDRHRGGRDPAGQLLEPAVVDHGALAVQLEDQGDGALVLGLVELGLHEVDEHPVEQPADLDDRHVTPRRGTVLRPGGARQHRHGQQQERGRHGDPG
jgi:hypothetical protein